MNQFIVHFFYELIFLFFSLQCWARLLPKVQRSSADISLHDKSRRLENPEIYSGLFSRSRKPERSDVRGRMGGQRRRPPMRRLSTGHVPRTGTNMIVRNILSELLIFCHNFILLGSDQLIILQIQHFLNFSNDCTAWINKMRNSLHFVCFLPRGFVAPCEIRKHQKMFLN
jgi:hypothetical protein